MTMCISYFFFIISVLFSLSGVILFLKYSNNVCILLHATKILNIYGINFFLIAICFSRFSYQFFLEILVVVTVNTLCSLTLLHILFKKSDVGDTTEYAKKREKMLENRRKYFREALKNRQIEQKNDAYEEDQISNQSGVSNEEEMTRRQNDFSIFFSDCMYRMKSNAEYETEEYSEKEIDEVIDDTEEKIKEQKRVLKKKIETARRNAYVTRKPEKIQETENTIKEILDKYDLTEEMLDED